MQRIAEPLVSVIIRCYNLGAYLDEAVGSVLAQSHQNYEVIIVDDGSTDPATVRLLDGYIRPNTKILRIPNQGLAAALNVGIASAHGQYILPLDADDKIDKSYLSKASKILDDHPEIGIVYCRASYFGARTGEWKLASFSLETMLIKNLIFVSAMFRKKTWQEIGGFNYKMVHGYEDYDFWLSILELENIGVHRIDEILFHYRIRENSMLSTLLANEAREIDMITQVFYNHTGLFLRDNRMRVLIAHQYNLAKEVSRLRDVINCSPTLRLEAALEKHPLTKRLYTLLYTWLFKLRDFLRG